MLFPSNIFLFCFLPVVLVLYYGGCHILLRNNITAKNILLLIASLIFYAYGEGWFVLLLVVSMVMNYVFGLLIDRAEHQKKLFLILALLCNLGLLFVFKYLDFVLINCNRFFHTDFPLTKLELPIGISFFTFQAVSYIADVYRGAAKVQKNPIKLGLYISLFPQLVAGPIVRYDAIEKQMDERTETYPMFGEGVVRFIVGLGKKVLLADTMALFAGRILTTAAGGNELSVSMAWLGAIAYTLQIYYDFSGYSDMAIGLGKMFGFTFMENFNYPYIAKSVSEFWRRWHISVATWFRDYVYIPLGGNTNSWKTYRNIFIVWLLTGIWHGAGWTYIAWGMLYFIVLVFERLTGLGRTRKLPAVFAHIYTMFIVIIGMVIFMAPSLSIGMSYVGNMLGIGAAGWLDSTTLFYLKDNWIFFTLSVLFVTPIGKKLEKISRLYQFLLGLVLILSIIYIIKGNYSPFIYFSF
ncbi:MAG: MBOAT family O-acyltransferase [Lachnospiraceae bacterium]